MEEFVKDLGITNKGVVTNDGAYVIDFKDFEDYTRCFNLLEKSTKVEEVQDTCQITLHTTNVTFSSDDYQLTLQADLDEDLYKLVVTKF